MENKLNKKLSVGLTYGMGKDEFIKIIDEFNIYIHDIYFSPPYGDFFYTRIKEAKYASKIPNIEKYLFYILEYALKKNIKLNLLINKIIPIEDITKSLEKIKKLIDINTITTLSKYVNIIKLIYPQIPLISSLNEGIKTKEKIDSLSKSKFFSTIVLGNSTLRDYDIYSDAIQKGFKIKIALNSGCSFRCNYFCNPSCYCNSMFDQNLNDGRSINELYAEQSVMPFELHEHFLSNNFFSIFKIANRPSNYRWLRNCLMSYINNDSESYLKKTVKYYHLWARLSVFKKYYNLLNYKEIISIKEKLWNNYQ
jgi:hypothetical protein